MTTKPPRWGLTTYDRLLITKEEVMREPRITERLRELFRVMPKNEEGKAYDAYYYLHTSGNPDAEKILKAYYSLPKSRREKMNIEVFCVSARVSSLKCLEIIFGTAARIAQEQTVLANAMAHIAQPRVLEQSLENAAIPGKEGFSDRQMLAKITGLLPMPKGPSTKITVTQNASASANIVATPPPESMIRRLADRFNESRSHQVIDVPQERQPLTDDVEGGPQEDV